MKKMLSLTLALMLALSCVSAFAVTTEPETQSNMPNTERNVYNFTEQTGSTLVYNDVQGFYLWTVPESVTLNFTTSEPTKDDAHKFGYVSIKNVLFNTDDNKNYFDDTPKKKKLDAEMLIVVGIDSRSDLTFCDTVYKKDTTYITAVEYSALPQEEKANWTEIKYGADDYPSSLSSTISTEYWKLYMEQNSAKLDANNSCLYTTIKDVYIIGEEEEVTLPFIDTNTETYLIDTDTTFDLYKDTPQDLLCVATFGDGSVRQIKTVTDKDKEIMQDPYDLYVGDNSYNSLVYCDALSDPLGEVKTNLYYTCFGIPTLLGKHEGHVTYYSYAYYIEIIAD